MVHGNYGGGLDTPRTNVGDATYLSRQPDFDMTQEPSFQSPPDKNNLFQQMRNGRPGAASLRTPRGSRAPLGNKRNLPAGIGGAEFTPMLKSATRNSARRSYGGKENQNGLATPALRKIEEDGDMTNIPVESSLYGPSRHSYVEATPMPETDNTSDASTPLVVLPRRGGDKGPLHDGNQLSLREQENVIDRIEKENFGLKLKIHFLEEALRKAGPGFGEAALKENTELKVDKFTMQRDLQKYKKQLANAEADLETYSKQILEVQERAKKKYADEGMRREAEKLRRELDEKDAEIEELHRRLDDGNRDGDKIEQLHDEIGDLQADLRQKEREVGEREEELEVIQGQLDETEEKWKSAEHRIAELEEHAGSNGEVDEIKQKLKSAERRVEELEQNAKSSNELDDAVQKWKFAEERVAELEQQLRLNDGLDEAKETIEDLEANVRQLEQHIDEVKEQLQEAVADKKRAEENLEELQDDMSNKSVVTKGFSRQLEEKVTRLQNELAKSQEKYEFLEQQAADKEKYHHDVKTKARQLLQQRESWETERRSLTAKLEEALKNQGKGADEKELLQQQREAWEAERQTLTTSLDTALKDLSLRTDEKSLLQLRHDALGDESASLQRDVARLEKQIAQLQDDLKQEKAHALRIEQDTRDQYRADIDRLNDEISDLQAEIREKDNLYDNDSEKWENEKNMIESEREQAEERATGLQRTIDKLREVEGSLSGKESRLQEALDSETERHKSEKALLSRQIDELRQDLEAKQHMLTEMRNEVSSVRDELRQSQLDAQTKSDKIEALEDELEILQAAMDEEAEEANKELAQAHEECEVLREQLNTARDNASSPRATKSPMKSPIKTPMKSPSRDANRPTNEAFSRLERQLSEAKDQISKAAGEKKSLEDQLAKLDSELQLLRTSHSKAVAETEAAEEELRSIRKQQMGSYSASARKQEAGEIRLQLSEMRQKLRDAERAASREGDKYSDLVQDLQTQVDMVEDEKMALEQSLADAQLAAEEARSKQEREVRRLEHEIYKLQHSRKSPGKPTAAQGQAMGSDERKELRGLLEKSQAEVAALEHDVLQQASLIKSHKSTQDKLRQKLDMARSEASTHRQSARKLRVDCGRLQKAIKETASWISANPDKVASAAAAAAAAAPSSSNNNKQQEDLRQSINSQESVAYASAKELARAGRASIRFEDGVLNVVDQRDHEAVIRAADEAARRHEKEIRGLALQMQFMHARWERESRLRSDAAFAKKYLELRLSLAEACNKADLRVLTRIHTQLGLDSPEALLASHRLPSSSSSQEPVANNKNGRKSITSSFSSARRNERNAAAAAASEKAQRNLAVFASAIRAVARMRIGARQWSKHEETRKKLLKALDRERKQQQQQQMEKPLAFA
ncbi:Microtubule associated protein [Apiospora rasikravindrae]|uniref:Microtubule associated protein n=1 Tax=Apiospora rasikravindrae TaxID=990691 RepID=A0ABR1TE48_9PEZI